MAANCLWFPTQVDYVSLVLGRWSAQKAGSTVMCYMYI